MPTTKRDLDDAPAAGAATPQRTPRVLILDEAPPVRAWLVEALVRMGLRESDLAITGEAEVALRYFREGNAPPLVFSEFVGVHNEDGLDVLHEMLDRAPRSRIVLVTSEPLGSPEVRAALRAGVFAVVEKPLRHEKIEHVLRDIEVEEGRVQRLR